MIEITKLAKTPVSKKTMEAKMIKSAVSLIALATVAAMPAGAALSDFIPEQSILLDPVPVNGLFEFNDIVIGEPVLVSIDRSVWLDQTVTLSAAGDITIYGALDAGNGPLALRGDNSILLDGKIYGDSLPIDAGSSFSWVNNPNGNPDLHQTGGVSMTLMPDGQLPIEVGGSLTNAAGGTLTVVDAGTLTGGVIFADAGTLSGGVVTELAVLDPVFIPYIDVGSLPGGFILTAGNTPVPLPPAVLLFSGALLALSARLRRSV